MALISNSLLSNKKKENGRKRNIKGVQIIFILFIQYRGIISYILIDSAKQAQVMNAECLSQKVCNGILTMIGKKLRYRLAYSFRERAVEPNAKNTQAFSEVPHWKLLECFTQKPEKRIHFRHRPCFPITRPLICDIDGYTLIVHMNRNLLLSAVLHV